MLQWSVIDDCNMGILLVLSYLVKVFELKCIPYEQNFSQMLIMQLIQIM